MERKAAASIDEYLAGVPEEKRAALQSLREQLHTLIPDAEETISYQIPTFKWSGRGVVAFSAAKNHCSLHLMSKSAMEKHKSLLTAFESTVATIQFQPDALLPESVLSTLIATRLEEVAKLPAKKK